MKYIQTLLLLVIIFLLIWLLISLHEVLVLPLPGPRNTLLRQINKIHLKWDRFDKWRNSLPKITIDYPVKLKKEVGE